MTVIYAVEAWISAILGCAWLSLSESLGFSLLSSHVFLSMLGLSTFNVILVGIKPASKSPRSAYFAAVVVLLLYASSCVSDTMYAPQLGSNAFASPIPGSKCTLAKTQQLFYFSQTQLFVLQGAGVLGYLLVQLIFAGAGLMDADNQSLWPGAAWGLGLLMLTCCRVFYMFDGSAKGMDDRSRYVQLFSLPVAEIATISAVLMYVTGFFLGLEGVPFDNLASRKALRYVSFVFATVSVGALLFILLSKGMLTPGILALLVTVMLVALGSLASTIVAHDKIRPAQNSATTPVFAGYPGAYPSAPPAQAVFRQPQEAPPVYQGFFPEQNRPPYPSAPEFVGGKLSSSKLRLPIPAPVEMLGMAMQKKKGV